MKANKYNLKVEFESGLKWDLLILAVNVTWIFCWIENNHKVSKLSIDLIEREVCEVAENFGAKSLQNNALTNETQP